MLIVMGRINQLTNYNSLLIYMYIEGCGVVFYLTPGDNILFLYSLQHLRCSQTETLDWKFLQCLGET